MDPALSLRSRARNLRAAVGMRCRTQVSFFIGGSLALAACAASLPTVPVQNPEPALAPASLPALPSLLQRPIILGSGLSTGLSPARQLALKFTSANEIYTIALTAKPATYLLPRVPDARFADRTVLIGLDLFFWDAQAQECAPVATEINRLFDRSALLKLPLILGDVPDLPPARPLPCRDTINRLLRRRCAARPDCRLVPLDELQALLAERGRLRAQGRLHDRAALLPDGLHPSPLGRMVIEELLERTVTQP